MTKKKTVDTKPASVAAGIVDNQDELFSFYKTPEIVNLTANVDAEVLELLEMRREHLATTIGKLNGVKPSVDKTLEEVIIFGLKNNQTFQEWLSKGQPGANTSGARTGENKTKQTTSGRVNPLALDDKEIENQVSSLGAQAGSK